MSRFFQEDGAVFPVTVIEAGAGPGVRGRGVRGCAGGAPPAGGGAGHKGGRGCAGPVGAGRARAAGGNTRLARRHGRGLSSGPGRRRGPVGLRRLRLGDFPGVPGALGLCHLGRPPADRDACPDQVQHDGQQLGIRPWLQPARAGLRQQVADPGVAERGCLPAGRQARPGQLVPGVRDGVLEEHAAPVPGVAADDPLALVPAAPRRGGAVVALQSRAVIPQPADLHPAPGDTADVMSRQQLIKQVRGRDLHRKPGLGERGREQRVGAVAAIGIPARGVFPQLAPLPDRFTDRHSECPCRSPESARSAS